MSDLKPAPDGHVEDIPSAILTANVKWAERLNQIFPHYFPDPKGKQIPKILWIGCSDSRVHESDATAALPGTVFVHRNIANQFYLHDDSAPSVLAYALGPLAVQHIAVVGHEHCGGVITAMKEARRPHDASQVKRHHTLQDSLYHVVDLLHHGHAFNEIHDEESKSPKDALTRWLTPLVERLRTIVLPPEDEEALRVAVEENVRMQVENSTGPEVEGFVRKYARRPVWVHGWVYDFSTGIIRDVQITKVLGADE